MLWNCTMSFRLVLWNEKKMAWRMPWRRRQPSLREHRAHFWVDCPIALIWPSERFSDTGSLTLLHIKRFASGMNRLFYLGRNLVALIAICLCSVLKKKKKTAYFFYRSVLYWQLLQKWFAPKGGKRQRQNTLLLWWVLNTDKQFWTTDWVSVMSYYIFTSTIIDCNIYILYRLRKILSSL